MSQKISGDQPNRDEQKENTLLKPTARGASSPLYLEAYPRRAVCYRHILLAQREAWIRELGENEERWGVRLGALPRMTSEAEGLDVVHSREPLDSAADEGEILCYVRTLFLG